MGNKETKVIVIFTHLVHLVQNHISTQPIIPMRGEISVKSNKIITIVVFLSFTTTYLRSWVKKCQV